MNKSDLSSIKKYLDILIDVLKAVSDGLGKAVASVFGYRRK